MTALVVSISPTATNTQTNQIARLPQFRSAISATSASPRRDHIPISDHLSEPHWYAGSDAAWSKDRAPMNRNTWTHTRGTRATVGGSGLIRGQTYHLAANA